MIVAQTTQPVFEIDLTRWRQALSLALVGASVGLYLDLNEWLKADGSAPFKPTKTIVRMASGALAGAAVGFGLNINTIGGWL